MKLYSSRVYLPDGCASAAIDVQGQAIADIERVDACPSDAINYGTQRIIPGIFDTHNHGTQGFDLMEPRDEEAYDRTVRGYLKGLASQGTVNVFPTVMSPAGIAAVARVAESDDVDGANIRGIHSEGPWLSRVGEKGIRTGWPEVSLNTAKAMVKAGGGMLRLVALAPEIPGIMELVDYFLNEGITVAAAHSDNKYAAAQAAYERGISVATHTGNVMTDMHHRDVGGLGAALLNDDVMCEVICDGMHICNEMLKIYFRVKSTDKFMMISDCTAFSGAPTGTYTSEMAPTINVTDQGFVLTDTGRLMGSSQSVLYGISNLVEHVGIPLEDCLKMASLNPAIKYGLSDRTGTIEVSKDADLVVISDDWKVRATYARGKKVYDYSEEGSVFNQDFVEAHLKRD